MFWLMAWILAHAVQITAVGAVLGTVASAESVVVNTTTIVKEVEKR